jgi:calcium-dependent protein kinase
MKNILIAVNYFHSKSIVHRDLKPENILIEFSNKKKPDEFTIKIIDFGASKKFNRKSKIRDFVGTPYYIAPEVIKGTYDEKCDIWSCGVILFLMLTGTTPFDGVSENEIFKKVEKGIPQEKLDMLKNSSEEANNLIIRMLDLDPKKRMTAKEALESNWITDNESLRVSSFKGQTQDILNRLCNTRMKEKMQSAVISFLVNQLVSRDEINELRELFMRLDKNNDGRLSYNEIMHGYKEYYGHPLLDVKEIFEKIDSDKNGYISYEEFICEAIDLKKVMDDEKLKTCFDLFDNDKNGLISADEIKDFLACGNSGFTDEIWEKMVKEADVNGDGEISLDEFKQMMIVLVDSNVIKL